MTGTLLSFRVPPEKEAESAGRALRYAPITPQSHPTPPVHDALRHNKAGPVLPRVSSRAFQDDLTTG